MASRLLQEACKVPWKLEPLPPKSTRPRRTRPQGGGSPLSAARRTLRRERTSNQKPLLEKAASCFRSQI